MNDKRKDGKKPRFETNDDANSKVDEGNRRCPHKTRHKMHALCAGFYLCGELKVDRRLENHDHCRAEVEAAELLSLEQRHTALVKVIVRIAPETAGREETQVGVGEIATQAVGLREGCDDKGGRGEKTEGNM